MFSENCNKKKLNVQYIFCSLSRVEYTYFAGHSVSFLYIFTLSVVSSGPFTGADTGFFLGRGRELNFLITDLIYYSKYISDEPDLSYR